MKIALCMVGDYGSAEMWEVCQQAFTVALRESGLTAVTVSLHAGEDAAALEQLSDRLLTAQAERSA